MSGAEILILGKLVLTFSALLGLPVLDLWLMRRKQARVEEKRVRRERGPDPR